MKKLDKEKKDKQPSIFVLLKSYALLVVLLIFLTLVANGLNLLVPKIISNAIDTYTNGNFALTSEFKDWDIWHFYTAILKSSNAKIYRDGVSVGTDSSVNLLTTSISSFTIGKYASYYWNGFIDDVRIFDAAIPSSQIKEQYYAGLNKLLASGQIKEEEYYQNLSNLENKTARE